MDQQTDSSSSTSPKPLIIAVAPNGARKVKSDHPAIPLTPAELAREAAACADAGASMVHLHVRDANGGHTLDADLYKAALNA
ncbi:MAG: 3-keto-5-aminohexanoate cleavage protein, partial [Pseudomonadota bacterium]